MTITSIPSMASKVPAKSILKQPSPQPTADDDDKAKADRDRRNLDIALYHANRIQQQRDVEKQILHTIELLIDYPQSAPDSDYAVHFFGNIVRIFQPSDFDDLAQERRIDGRCGYALCAKTPRAKPSTPSWAQSQNSVTFCSSACADTAAYVKSQLSPVPAWERQAGQHPVISLKGDTVPQDVRQVTTELQKLKVANAEDLALERGEKVASLKPKQVMTDLIVEKPTVAHKPMSSLNGSTLSSTAIEGYEPRGQSQARVSEVDDDDSDDERGAVPDRVDSNADEDDETWRELFDDIDERGVGANAWGVKGA